jgi:hypothetical protein
MSGKTGHMPIRGPEQQNEIAYYTVPGLIDDGHVLALNQRLGLLSHLAPADGANGPRLLAQEQFSASEVSLLRPLLEQYPDFCPYEVAWASFNTGQVTKEAVERARKRLQEAQFAGVWDYELRPVRNILSRTRFKLRAFGIDARSILETGYLLKRL